jgi:hypothetical protein
MNRPLIAIACVFLLVPAAPAPAQELWREYPSIERGWYGRDAPVDQEPGEFVVGRLMFPQIRRGYMLGAGPGDWRAGGTAWTVDYPEGDRTFARLLERLTTIDVRLVEQPVNLDDDVDAYYWPFMISGLVGAWDLTDASREAARVSAARRLPALRQLLRYRRVGGFRARPAPRVPGPADRRLARYPPDLPRGL